MYASFSKTNWQWKCYSQCITLTDHRTCSKGGGVAFLLGFYTECISLGLLFWMLNNRGLGQHITENKRNTCLDYFNIVSKFVKLFLCIRVWATINHIFLLSRCGFKSVTVRFFRRHSHIAIFRSNLGSWYSGLLCTI